VSISNTTQRYAMFAMGEQHRSQPARLTSREGTGGIVSPEKLTKFLLDIVTVRQSTIQIYNLQAWFYRVYSHQMAWLENSCSRRERRWTIYIVKIVM